MNKKNLLLIDVNIMFLTKVVHFLHFDSFARGICMKYLIVLANFVTSRKQ